MKKKTQIEDTVKCVTLDIHTHDGRTLEIPLEVWQVSAICEILGLCVNTAELDTWRMCSKEGVEENMEFYHAAIKNLNRKDGNDMK